MVVFIILHYKNIKDTLECIESIKKLKGSKKIVVVDNYTLSEEEAFSLKKQVDDLICLSDNLGFARANNKGCQLAISKYRPDFLTVINNDTVLYQDDFLKRIKAIYKRTHFDTLGPKILCEEGSGSVNPYSPLKTIEEVQKEIKYQERLLKYYHSSFLYFGLCMYIRLKAWIKHPSVMKNGSREEVGVALHGCALIFSKKYYEKYDTVFFDDTFLFHEESFLYLRVRKDHLISVYSPEIEIEHKEGKSLETVFSKNKRQKLLFRTEEILKSLRLLEKEMKESDYEKE